MATALVAEAAGVGESCFEQPLANASSATARMEEIRTIENEKERELVAVPGAAGTGVRDLSFSPPQKDNVPANKTGIALIDSFLCNASGCLYKLTGSATKQPGLLVLVCQQLAGAQ